MIIQGNTFTDHRGTLLFVNDFHFEGIRRFYTINHPDTSVIRAWQGHKIETKHFFVTKGMFLICWVEIDRWDKPGKSLKVNKQILNAKNPQILMVPAGHANGFKALEFDSTVIIFSDLTLEESANDTYRFEAGYWACEL
jgi:dTDP-4-dehydrorhamnose 3,5-epimerase-like enzyme